MRTHNEGFRRGKAAIAGAACVAALAIIVLLATSAGGSGGGYQVRAIFDDAGNLTVGEDVKIDGVKVGTVGSVTPTPHAKAAVVLEINNPGFQDFREDASCTIRPQALIGEKFVDCLPTQPREEGTPLPPPLKTIPSGQEGAGQVLLPVTGTHSPVDPDLLGDITRLPEAQRLTIILNELGTGFAGRGSDLNAVLHRSNPALQGLEQVLAILAKENKTLTDLAVEGDRATAPLAADRDTPRGLHQRRQDGRRRDRQSPRCARSEPSRLPGFPRTAGAGDGTARALRRADDAHLRRPRHRRTRNQQDVREHRRRSQSPSKAS